MLKINLLFLSLCFIFSIHAKTIEVSSHEEFKQAQINAVSNDTILWLPGTYKDVFLNITTNNITVQAKELGKTIFTGASKAFIKGNGVTFKGFQYIDGDAGSSDIIVLAGDHIRVIELNMLRYKGHKYLHMKNNSQYNLLSRCNFETRTNNIDKNIISIGANGERPNFHKLEYCSFRNFDGTGGDMGVEPIRIGSSTQASFDSKTIVEYCYFTQCNGDSEIISNKSCKNIFRYNTFEDNPLAELVLRHGNESYVYGNFFLRGKGGVRAKEGSNHYIFNNYFNELKDRSIALFTGGSNPVKNVYIMNNTFVNTAKLHLGGNKTVIPKKVVFANNLFSSSGASNNIGNATGKELWIGNMYQGSLGIPATKGLTKIAPLLHKNEFGFFEPEKKSPVINSSVNSKIKLPVFTGLDPDTMLALDIVKNKRPIEPTQKDVGCLELTAAPAVFKPFATSENTGPSYKTGLIKEEKKPKKTEKTQETQGTKETGGINEKPLVVDQIKDEKIATEKPKEELSEVEKLKKEPQETGGINEKPLIADQIKDEKIATEKPKEELSEVEKLKKQIRELQAKVDKIEKQNIEVEK